MKAFFLIVSLFLCIDLFASSYSCVFLFCKEIEVGNEYYLYEFMSVNLYEYSKSI